MTRYEIVKEYAHMRTTWKAGARQRNAGARWYVYKDGTRLRLCGPNTRDGGFTTQKAAVAWIASREAVTA